MDRLPLVAVALAAAALLIGCQDPPPLAASRVDAAPAKKRETEKPEAFCDVFHTPAEAPQFAFPALDTEPPPPVGTWRWVNVWATWCKPCVAEMPMIREWAARLRTAGSPVQLTFLSVNGSRDEMQAYAKANATTDLGLRMRDAGNYATMRAWLDSLGLESSAAIPIQAFIDANGGLRCVRTGSLSYYHYDTIAALVARR